LRSIGLLLQPSNSERSSSTFISHERWTIKSEHAYRPTFQVTVHGHVHLGRMVTGLSIERQHDVWHNDHDTFANAQTDDQTENYILRLSTLSLLRARSVARLLRSIMSRFVSSASNNSSCAAISRPCSGRQKAYHVVTIAFCHQGMSLRCFLSAMCHRYLSSQFKSL
jgi:hypothetical protein